MAEGVRRSLLAVLSVTLTAAGCASGDGNGAVGTDEDTTPDGVIRVEGVVTDEGVECPAIRASDNTLYTLAGSDLGALEPGTSVVVEGTVAEISICMQGTTISVLRLERR